MSPAKRSTKTIDKPAEESFDDEARHDVPANGEEQDVALAADDGETSEIRDDSRKWYVIHTYSGYENKVKTNLEHRIDSMGVRDKIFQVIIPTEEEIEIKDGQRRTVQRKVFPGYVLVEMVMGDDSWYVVRTRRA